MNRQAAIAFIRSTGDLVEQARLRQLLDGERPAPAVIQQLFAGQHEDGGWSPFWVPEYSSVDATCFRLAQAEQLGMTVESRKVVPINLAGSLTKSYPTLPERKRYDLVQQNDLKAGKEIICDNEDKRPPFRHAWRSASMPLPG